MARAHLARALFVISALSALAVLGVVLRGGNVSPPVWISLVILQLFFLVPALWLGRLLGALALGLVILIAGAMGLAAVLLTSNPAWLAVVSGYVALGAGLFGIEKWFEQERGFYAAKLEALDTQESAISAEFAALRARQQALAARHAAFSKLRKMAEEFATTIVLSDLKPLVLSGILEEIMTCEEGLLYLFNDVTQKLELCARERREPTDFPEEKYGNAIDAWILRHHENILVEDLAEDARFRETLGAGAILNRSVMAAPLLDKGRAVGTIRLVAQNPYAFDGAQFRLFNLMVVLASSAVTNAMLFERTQRLAVHDSLTGLYVRRYFLQRFEEEHQRATLRKTPLACMMCDVDHFKRYNDTFGHAAGDLALQHIARIIKATAPVNAVAARYGGEEFSVLLPDSTRTEALALAEDIRAAVEKTEFRLRKRPMPLTVSIGVAALAEDALDLEEMIRVADSFLYEAKHKGRNRVRGGG